LENWGKIVPLDHATEVGKAIATRLETFGDHWVNTEQDQQTIDYLATSSAGTFFGYSELGQTTDTGDPSRRARIVSFLKSTEDSWIQKHGQPSNEKQWSDYYSRLLTFLNPKDAPIESDNKAGWILSYSVYYLTVWNYKEINGFEKADSNDPLEIKFRGFLGAALDKGRPFIHSLIEKMSTLDKSTRIVINDHGPKGIATKFDSMLARMPIRRNDST
jgi:hypothetical protein